MFRWGGYNRYRRRYYRSPLNKPKKKSLSSKIDNLSYDGLLKWEHAYKNKINEIEKALDLNEFKRINKQLKERESTITNISSLKEEIKKYRSNFKMEIDHYIHRKFWSTDKGFIIGNLICKDDKKMDEIILKIKKARDEWRGLIYYHNYFNSIEENINRFRKDLNIEKEISKYYSSDYSLGSTYLSSSDILDSFYPNTGLYFNDRSQKGVCHYNTIEKKPVKITNVANDSEKYTICSKAEVIGIDPSVILYLIGDFFEKIVALGLGDISFPKSPPEEVIIKYRNFLLEKSKNHLRKIQLKIRSKKRASELSKNENYVYIMSSEDLPKDSYKIGWTSNLPEERAEELSGTSVLHDYKVEYSKKFKDAEKIEKKIHKHFEKFRIRKNKEIFKLKIEEIIKHIESL